MPRKLRIEYEGALYHVLNRGNYRRDVFETAGAAQSFVEALEEASARYSWRVHAYVLMRNHYHLALETPEPTLIDGMHWLQSTVATRFNRFRSERGHLFQGRYQAILLEDVATLTRVVDYLHLNPARAGIVSGENVVLFRWSSLPRFVKGRRFAQLVAEDWLSVHGFADSPVGWSDYLGHLADLGSNVEEQQRGGFDQLSHGWAIGTDRWRKALAQDHAHRAICPGIDAQQARDLKEARWAGCLGHGLAKAKRTEADARADIKGAPWKLALARKLRSEGASIHWITETLDMGKPSSLRSLLCRKCTDATISASTP